MLLPCCSSIMQGLPYVIPAKDFFCNKQLNSSPINCLQLTSIITFNKFTIHHLVGAR